MLNIAFVWHMHQPNYRDPRTGVFLLPWVRMHALRNYHRMVAMLDDFPDVRQTFNLVPVLLEQIQDYTDRGASDVHLDLSRKPADSLNEEERTAILRDFFMANWYTMVDPVPRYRELLEKRGRRIQGEDLRRISRSFSTRDYLDLQVWFNLAWLDPADVEADRGLHYLAHKGGSFAEHEKAYVLDKHLELMRRVIPRYRKAQDRGQIELATSPYYHPILPLLVDTESAREALPEARLPRRFAHPEDARHHLIQARALMQQLFGRDPKGLWPSEGSVSGGIVPLVSEAGFEWLASDEGILARSLGRTFPRDADEIPADLQAFYSPYVIEREGRRISALFRDHLLSDLIGFSYYHLEPDRAADDFTRRLREISSRLGPRIDGLVTIILDGENPWEHYPGAGRQFLGHLYRSLSASPDLALTTVAGYLEGHPARRALPRIFAGSWIDANFGIWIGHREDAAAWELLGRTRNDLVQFERAHPRAAGVEQAWKALYAAEGSDWCWWYGPEHQSGRNAEFDTLYRLLLMSVYQHLGQRVPDDLYEPISQGLAEEDAVTEPLGLLHPELDGEVTHFYEWTQAGRIEGTRGGALHTPDTVVKGLFFGFDSHNLYLRLDPRQSLISREVEFTVEFLSPRRQRITFRGGAGTIEARFLDGGPGGWIEKPAHGVQIVAKRIVEMKVPFADLGSREHEQVEFMLTAVRKGRETERWPAYSVVQTRTPSADEDSIHWTA